MVTKKYVQEFPREIKIQKGKKKQKRKVQLKKEKDTCMMYEN